MRLINDIGLAVIHDKKSTETLMLIENYFTFIYFLLIFNSVQFEMEHVSSFF